jgi:hypothetical protein
VNAACIWIVFLIGRRVIGENGAVAAAAAYAALAVSPAVAGMASHATQFVILFGLAGALLLLERRFAWAGVCFGLSFLMKQHGVFFLLFGAAWMLYARAGWRALARYAAAGMAPYAATCLLLWRAGVFANFWFWTVTYAGAYASRVPLGKGLGYFAATFWSIVWENPLIWALAAVGAVLAVRAGKPAFLMALLVFSFLTSVPGLLFREHYFIPLMPAVALLAGVAAERRWAQWTLAAAIALSLFTERRFFFVMNPVERARYLWGDNPFPEAIPAAEYLAAHTAKETPVAVLGSEPEIYFYSHRHSATGYIYMYGLMEEQPYALRMQQELIAGLEKTRPEYIVDVDVATSWLRRDRSATRIFDWWDEYQEQHYTLERSYGDLGIYRRKD